MLNRTKASTSAPTMHNKHSYTNSRTSNSAQRTQQESSYTAGKLQRRSWIGYILQCFPVLLILGIISYTILILYQFELGHSSNNHSASRQQSVVLLKLPRSGSSWFVQLLNQLPDVYISKEIIQRDDLQTFSSQVRARHIVKALASPTDKIAYVKKRWLPSGRFMEDYWLHSTYKWLRPLRMVGISINPEYLKDMDWDILRRERFRQPVKFIAYLRSNLVKQSLSGITGQELKLKCGTNNLRDARVENDCTRDFRNHPPEVSLLRLAEELEIWTLRYRHFFHYVQLQITQMHHWPIHVLYYEQLQSDTVSTIQQVTDFVHSDLQSYTEEQLSSILNSHITSSQWKKRTSDDLSQVLGNYWAIRTALKTKFPAKICGTVVEMLEEKYYRVFPLDMGLLTEIFNCARFIQGDTRAVSKEAFIREEEDVVENTF